MQSIRIIGAGLAGCEAALYLADAGFQVDLYEQKPHKFSPAHKNECCAELVCSNSLKADRLDSAGGVLKAEMKLLGSHLLPVAETCRVAAGGALAVDRAQFAQSVTQLVEQHEKIALHREEVTTVEEAAVDVITLIAAGPLTDGALAQEIVRLTGESALAFYDAAAPIVTAESLDQAEIFAASRYDRGTADYLNCPFDKEGYEAFHAALVSAERAQLHAFEGGGRPVGDAQQDSRHADRASGNESQSSAAPQSADCEKVCTGVNCVPQQETGAPRACFAAKHTARASADGYSRQTAPQAERAHVIAPTTTTTANPAIAADSTAPAPKITVYEGCMPIEIMAQRGADTMRYGPLRPVGLRNPRTGHRPWANVQLRAEDSACRFYNLVGFQTNLKFAEQKRVFSMIPGLANAQFVRYGVMHRNTFLNSPLLLANNLSLKGHPNVFFAGQITGFEGYMESAASGLLAAHAIEARLRGKSAAHYPHTTMCGALLHYIAAPNKDFQPMGANMGLLPPPETQIRDKRARYLAVAQRAVADMQRALEQECATT